MKANKFQPISSIPRNVQIFGYSENESLKIKLSKFLKIIFFYFDLCKIKTWIK